jgi:hypothetical protein
LSREADKEKKAVDQAKNEKETSKPAQPSPTSTAAPKPSPTPTATPKPASDPILDPGVRAQLIKMFSDAGYGKWETEESGYLIKTDSGQSIQRDPSSGRTREQPVSLPPPQGAEGYVHTHPNSCGAYPGYPGDFNAANKLQMPVYVLHRLGITRIDPGKNNWEWVQMGKWYAQ